MYQDYEQPMPEMQEIPPGSPQGSFPVNFNLPIPTSEQIAGEVARQITRPYDSRGFLEKIASGALQDRIAEIIHERVTPLINEILDRPMQPTDGFGNPVGEPTTLQGFVAARVNAWANDLVDREGRIAKPERYGASNVQPRITWELAELVNSGLKKAVDVEVKNIVSQLKADATKVIAVQIAEKISGLVIK